MILIDDGIAMGSTMGASIELCKIREAVKIVVAVPVAGREVAEEIGKKVNELIVLETLNILGLLLRLTRNGMTSRTKKYLICSERG